MSIRNISCKLFPDPENDVSYQQTSEQFADACNQILKVALEHKTSNAIKLHQLCYRSIRNKCKLSANLAVRAIRRVAATVVKRKSQKRKPPRKFRPGSIDYDARIFSFFEEKMMVTLTTVRGRKKAFLCIGEYQKNALKGKKLTCATLVKRGDDWYLNICIEVDDSVQKGDAIIGVDLGIRNIVYTNTGFASTGKSRQQFKEKRAAIRASLQSKNTRKAKALLKKLSGYEIRRIRHENHTLSKQLIEEAKRHNAGVIRMEQLKDIRNRTRVWNKHLNRMIAGWSFYQFQRFVEYKAKTEGMTVEYVNPSFTSQTCYKCDSRGQRSEDVFECTTCGKCHADYNAAWMIAKGGAVVNRPELTIC